MCGSCSENVEEMFRFSGEAKAAQVDVAGELLGLVVERLTPIFIGVTGGESILVRFSI